MGLGGEEELIETELTAVIAAHDSFVGCVRRALTVRGYFVEAGGRTLTLGTSVLGSVVHRRQARGRDERGTDAEGCCHGNAAWRVESLVVGRAGVRVDEGTGRLELIGMVTVACKWFLLMGRRASKLQKAR